MHSLELFGGWSGLGSLFVAFFLVMIVFPGALCLLIIYVFKPLRRREELKSSDPHSENLPDPQYGKILSVERVGMPNWLICLLVYAITWSFGGPVVFIVSIALESVGIDPPLN